MAKASKDWHGLLPGGLPPAAFSLDELRAAKSAHASLTEEIPGPKPIGDAIRAFRYLTFFAVACVAEDKYPPLTRCWRELEELFMHRPAFGDGVFVQSWVLLDFPFGPAGETALDYFADFVAGTESSALCEPFIESARQTRLGLYQDVGRTKKAGKFRELFTNRVLSVFPTVGEHERGEIFLVRMMKAGEHTFLFGDPKGFPRDRKRFIEDMIIDKLFYLEPDFLEPTEPREAAYEKFMKLAGPYWFSIVGGDEDAPILNPDHYLSYVTRGK